ncbi:MAG: TetR/AcrR family transcriptional regulator [Spirochaetales bacterium]|nr:TetR/AcrR family transcriptional regulator [Spirochaetales bacterium]
MPLKTFLNLEPEKQKDIINICIKEFALNDYESASFSRITRKVGITKAGFYRYFESKQSLYNHLLKLVGNLIGDLMKKYFFDSKLPVFDVFKEYFLELIDMERTYPHFLLFLIKASGDKMNTSRAPKWRLGKMEFLQSIMESQQFQGFIRKDIDSLTLAFFFQQTVQALMGVCRLKYAIDYHSHSSKSKKLSDIPTETMVAEINGLMKLFKEGLEKK